MSKRSMLFAILSFLFAVITLGMPAPRARAARERQNGQGAEKSKIRRMYRPVPGEYMVALKDSEGNSNVRAAADRLMKRYGGEVMRTYEHAFKGFAAKMNERAAQALSNDPDVEAVEENALTEPSGVVISAPATQSTPPSWGLDRIDQRARALDGAYSYSTTGSGVNAYIIDTGINFYHAEFQGRVIFDAEFAENNPTGGLDCYGHGTWVAGIIGGTNYGVAKGVTLHVIRIAKGYPGQKDRDDPRRCDGGADTSLVTAGVDWVLTYHVKPAVVNLSWNLAGDGADIDPFTKRNILEAAVKKLIDAGVTVVNSAGNNNTWANSFFPSNMPEVIVVGGSNSTDMRYTSSNYGPTVDVHAPAVTVNAPDIFGPNSIVYNITGTSFAAPHVVGVVTRYLQMHPDAIPAQVQDYIINTATPNTIRGFNDYMYTPNRLLYVQP